jgi:hypothetical protein
MVEMIPAADFKYEKFNEFWINDFYFSYLIFMDNLMANSKNIRKSLFKIVEKEYRYQFDPEKKEEPRLVYKRVYTELVKKKEDFEGIKEKTEE